MNKTFLHIVLSLLLSQFCMGQTNNNLTGKTNYIDSIGNAKQITDLISKIDDPYKQFKLNDTLKFTGKECQHLSDTLNLQPWAKADFDNNGLTDIVIFGYSLFIVCILDKDSIYEIKTVTNRSVENCHYVTVENKKIKYNFESEPERGKWEEPRKLEQITLAYKFGEFIEDNQTPANHRIEKIEYSTKMCFGKCPVFNLTINADKTANWKAEKFNKINNKEIEGSFNSAINEQNYNDIINLLNYIDFETLKNSYTVNWTDVQSSNLTITYNGGKVKSINDYGLIGTYGLERVYKLLFELRENQEWKK